MDDGKVKNGGEINCFFAKISYLCEVEIKCRKMKKISILLVAFIVAAMAYGRTNMNEKSQCSYLDGKNISILGDSYSTFIGWIPQGYAVWYNPTSKKTDVHQVENTWWWKLCDKTHATLLTNSSYSGSTYAIRATMALMLRKALSSLA